MQHRHSTVAKNLSNYVAVTPRHGIFLSREAELSVPSPNTDLRAHPSTTLWSWLLHLGSPTRSTAAKNLSIYISVTPEHSGSGSLAIDPFRINGAAHFARSHPMDGSLGSFIQLIFNQLGCSSSNYIRSCSVMLGH